MIITAIIAALTIVLLVHEGGQLAWVMLLVCIGFALLYWRRLAAILVVAFVWSVAANSPSPRSIEFLLVEPSEGRPQATGPPELSCLEFEKSGPPTMRNIAVDQCSIGKRQAEFSRLLGTSSSDRLAVGGAVRCPDVQGIRVGRRAHQCSE